MPQFARKLAQLTPVLFLERDRLAVYVQREDGSAPFAEVELTGANVVDVVHSARELYAGLGLHPGPCVLALGEGLYEQRLLTLPKLAAKDLAQVLQRKAANLVGMDERAVAFQALPLQAPFEEAEGGARYLILAWERSRLLALVEEMRRAGFSVQQMPIQRLASVQAACSELVSTPSVQLVLSAERNAVTFSLVRGDELLHQAVAPGAIQADNLVAGLLIQELRNLVLYWRRVSRGEDLRSVSLVGFQTAVAENLEPAIQALQPGALVRRWPESTLASQSGRIAALAACACKGAFQLDLRPPLPPRKRVVVSSAIVLATLVGACALGSVRYLRRVDRRLQLQAEVVQDAAGDVEQKEQLEERLTSVREEVQAEQARLQALARLGLDTRGLLEELHQVFSGRAALLNLTADAATDHGLIHVTGSTQPDPAASLAALLAMQQELERGQFMSAVRCIPPSMTPEVGTAKEGDHYNLHFQLQASLRPRP